MNTASSVNIADMSNVAEARRLASHCATQAGFDEVRAGRFAIVVSEAASNVHKHVGSGEIIINFIRRGDVGGLELLALDTGRGIENIHQSMRDGYSTAGTAGTGLGAMQRQSDEFDIFSLPGKGTVVWARVWSSDTWLRDAVKSQTLDIDGISVPLQGERVCGDGWLSKTENQGTSILVCDGLGHGPLAAAATAEAKRIFMQQSDRTPPQLLEDIHRGIRGTRGAAVAIARLDEQGGRIDYCGIGNISGVIVAEKAHYMISQSGTVGHTATKFQNFSYTWPPDAVVLMFSDGLQTRLNLNNYTGLARRSTTLISGLLYRDFKRGRDDATVVAVRRRAA